MTRSRPARVDVALGAMLLGAAACSYDFARFTAADGAGDGGRSIISTGGTAAGGIAAVAGVATGATSTPAAASTPSNGGGAGDVGAAGSPFEAGGRAGGTTRGGAPTGGVPTGGVPTGGVPTGGTPNGGVPTGGTTTGGTTTAGSAGTTSGAAAGAGAGAAGTGGCAAGTKRCGETCVPLDDPATGCSAEDCAPCVVPNGTATCEAGACAVGTCDDGLLSCDDPTTGCTIGWDSFTETHCGGCDNSCTSQGFAGGLICQNGGCACTSPAQCGNRGTYDCVGGACVCEGATCQPGETCSVRDGPDQICGCNGQPACAVGMTCCWTPRGCRDLQNDADNCGACGWRCPVGTPCVAGVCR